MEFSEVIKERYSVRKFSAQKVEDEKIAQILAAARLAPTAVNMQPQRYYVITGAEEREKMKQCTKYTFDAPLFLLICYDKDACWERSYDGAKSGETDASIVTTYMMLKLVELGLGCTWVGYFDPAAMRREYQLPDNLIPHALLPIGYPAADAEPSARHPQRKPAEEITTYL